MPDFIEQTTPTARYVKLGDEPGLNELIEEIEKLTNDPAYREMTRARQLREYADMAAQFIQRGIEAAPVNRGGEVLLQVLLPERRETEALLPWLGRVQQAALTAAMDWANRNDPDLEVDPTPKGYLVTHLRSGQRVEIATKQEVERADP